MNRDQAAIEYPVYIKEELVLNHLGEIINNLSAFDVDLSKEVKKSIVEDDENIPLEERTSLLPLYIYFYDKCHIDIFRFWNRSICFSDSY